MIQRHLKDLQPAIRTLVATGDPGSGRADILQSFKPGSTEQGIIGLCSDSLAEGVNLQQASALVHLDMPSVVRIAEQRVGRVDRMDSPHREIEAWWPEDAPEFALSSDDRFVERYETVESLLGSNMPLPEGMQNHRVDPLRTEQLIREYEQESERSQWDGIQDAFEPVRSLIQGGRALVDDKTYEAYRTITTRVMSGSAWYARTARGRSFVSPQGASAHPGGYSCRVSREHRSRTCRWFVNSFELISTAKQIISR